MEETESSTSLVTDSVWSQTVTLDAAQQHAQARVGGGDTYANLWLQPQLHSSRLARASHPAAVTGAMKSPRSVRSCVSCCRAVSCDPAWSATSRSSRCCSACRLLMACRLRVLRSNRRRLVSCSRLLTEG